MLLQLNIINFALIEKLSISFQDGFNVLSGETGAGKSILIDAINYVLGGKFTKEIIRTGTNKTFVEAVFSISNPKTIKILEEYEIEFEDLVIISRETFETGKSIVKVNGKSILVSALKVLSQTLLDIHGQHENVGLLDSSNHIDYLDSFGGEKMQSLLAEYRIGYNTLVDLEKKIEKLQDNDNDNEKLKSYLKYQIDEIDRLKLKKNEDIELDARFELLSHAEKINSVLNNSYELLYNGTDSAKSIFDSLGFVIKELRTIDKHMERAAAISNSLQDAYYNIEQNISEIRAIKDEIIYDAEELAVINNRIFDLSKIKKKYGDSIDEVLLYKEKIEKQYDEITNSEDTILKLKKHKDEEEEKCKVIAEKIHILRTELALMLQSKIKEELDYVGMEKSCFIVEVSTENKLFGNGCDKVQFLISTNPGEPPKSIDKIASGGELSRIMLGIKCVFIHKDNIPTVIFDEIDTGISGRIAQRVAEKMFLISTTHQVLCVTHSPQIASMSQTHFYVYKDVIQDKTFTNIKLMNELEKQEEIAKMIGGVEVTNITLENSKEMISLAEKIKIKIKKN